jgi:hypothetical protein
MGDPSGDVSTGRWRVGGTWRLRGRQKRRPPNRGLAACLQRSVETPQTGCEEVSEASRVGASPRRRQRSRLPSLLPAHRSTSHPPREQKSLRAHATLRRHGGADSTPGSFDPPGLPLRPAHGRGVRHQGGDGAGVYDRRSRVVEPRPGAAGDGPAAGRAAARRGDHDRPGGPLLRSGGGRLGAARGGGVALQPDLPARHALAVHGGERGGLGRRPGGSDAGRGLARPGQPRPLPAGLHRLRGAARHLPAGLADPHPAPPRAGLQLRRRGSAARGARPRPLGAAVLEPQQSHRQAGLRRRATAWPSSAPPSITR